MLIGSHIVKHFIRIYAKELKRFKNNNQLIDDIDINEWFINPIELFDVICSGKKFNDDEYYDNILSLAKNISEEEIADIGNAVLSCIICDDKYFKNKNIRDGIKTYKQILFNDDFKDIIAKNSVNTLFLPMICRPIMWTDKHVGGFITEELRNIAFPNESFVKWQNKLIEQSEVSFKQYDTINYMNNVTFKINKNVLLYVLNEWFKENSKLFKGYNKLHSQSYKTDDITSTELFKEIQAHNSKYYHYYNTILLACLYKDISFYLPTFLDFRGRIYTKISYLSYQGVDLARSLLEFDTVNKEHFSFISKEDKFGSQDKDIFEQYGFRFIKEYAGNVYNLSKKTSKEKIEWCDKFISEINEIYSINLKKGIDINKLDSDIMSKYLDDADEPFQFISVYFAIKDYIVNKNYRFNIPILFDASCSGIQHLASLANDLSIAKMVNVVSTEDCRNDFYSIAAEYVNKHIKTMETSDNLQNNLLNLI